MKLIVYTAADCAPCRNLKEWLNKNSFEYEERQAETHLQEMVEKGLQRRVPCCVYGDKVIYGYNTIALYEVLTNEDE